MLPGPQTYTPFRHLSALFGKAPSDPTASSKSAPATTPEMESAKESEIRQANKAAFSLASLSDEVKM